ncbi:MAG: (Fe-S)-binding protein [Candidatus Hodarchaeota archaeon]
MTIKTPTLDEWLHHCIRCGNCKYVFRNYGPSCPSGEHFNFETYFASGRIWLARGLLEGDVSWDQSLSDPIFACTTCGACEVQCLAVHREHIIDMIEELRALAVENIEPPPGHSKFRQFIEKHHNPYGEEHHARYLVEEHALSETSENVLFIGCTSNYRETQIRDATISVLKKARIDFTIADERCCGSPLLRTGQRQLAKELAQHNSAALALVEAKRIITSCAGCYRTLCIDYPKLGIDLGIEVVHSSLFFEESISNDSLRISDIQQMYRVTYHDPCHLARHMGVYDSPRNVLSNLPVDLIEMEYTRENSWCCGSGGGAKPAFSDWAIETGKKRIEHARRAGAKVIVSTCPFCSRNLRDSASSEKVEIVDLAELVDRFT